MGVWICALKIKMGGYEAPDVTIWLYLVNERDFTLLCAQSTCRALLWICILIKTVGRD